MAVLHSAYGVKLFLYLAIGLYNLGAGRHVRYVPFQRDWYRMLQGKL